MTVHDEVSVFGGGGAPQAAPQREPANAPAGADSAMEAALSAATPIRRDQPKVGRNEPCPCGSGKKYKKCCGAGD